MIFENGTQLKTYDSKNNTKKCTNPLCNKVHNINTFFCDCYKKNTMGNQNLIDFHLSGFLPHLPYSWCRSITNLEMLIGILKEVSISSDIYKNDIKAIKNNILQSFLEKGLVSVDPSKRDQIKYIKGGPERRISEYLLALQVLGLLDKNFNLSELAKLLMETKNTIILLICFYKLKLKNKFLVSKIYSGFDVRHFKAIFSYLYDDGNKLSIEEMMFFLMAQRDQDYENLHIPLFKESNFSQRQNALKRYYLGDKNKEVGRQKAAIFNLLVNAGIFIESDKFYHLSEQSKNILKFIEENENDLDMVIFLKDILKKNKPANNDLINKSGGLHEKNMIKYFSKKDIDFRKYDKMFSNIQLPANVLSSLPGGTVHNPDHLCTVKSKTVLVDSKSSASIHSEIHKLIAYSEYARIVDSKAFIFLDGDIPKKTLNILKKIIEEDSSILKNVVLFSRKAIDEFLNKSTLENIFNQILNNDGFLMVIKSGELLNGMNSSFILEIK